jgi:exodeoxyribonuclease VII small subunit
MSAKEMKPVEKMTYEAAFAELEKTIDDLENGQSTLEEALQLFERGQQLAQRCGALLENAELKVRQVLEMDSDETESEEG